MYDFVLWRRYAYRTTGEKAAADIVLARKETSRERARMACRIISQRPMYMFALDNNHRGNPQAVQRMLVLVAVRCSGWSFVKTVFIFFEPGVHPPTHFITKPYIYREHNSCNPTVAQTSKLDFWKRAFFKSTVPTKLNSYGESLVVINTRGILPSHIKAPRHYVFLWKVTGDDTGGARIPRAGVPEEAAREHS